MPASDWPDHSDYVVCRIHVSPTAASGTAAVSPSWKVRSPGRGDVRPGSLSLGVRAIQSLRPGVHYACMPCAPATTYSWCRRRVTGTIATRPRYHAGP